ncbi:MAG: efflux RND transporter periplasmic adaptor subunit [Bacteroidia bacterium]|nr:efflux RND transporter periplasmic adaptor subunit [Bacteroidia bacterium]
MKKNWKFDKGMARGNGIVAFSVFIGIAILIFISSCSSRDEHKHIQANKTSELEGLEQPTNQTVFSDVKTILPMQQTITPRLNAIGVIVYDPRSLNNISARFSGRIEKLYVHFNFENVFKGQRIMDIYSPEILTEQQNLIYLLNNSLNDLSLINSSKTKLQLLGLNNEQLEKIETTKQPINPLPIYSPYTGHIQDLGISSGVTSVASSKANGMSSGMNTTSESPTQMQVENLSSSRTSALSIKEGMYLQSGQAFFSVYNISQVWAVLDIFPQDAALIHIGDKVSLTTETNPTNVIHSTISYIEPVAGQNYSAIKARVYLKNSQDLQLKIGTLVSANITSSEIKGIWLPRNAIVNLGYNQIVFVKSENRFVAKVIQTGVLTDSLVQIKSGLKENEMVAANAQFMVDSESFIQTENNVQK